MSISLKLADKTWLSISESLDVW